ncbi:bla regulator protein blaR1 [Fictibacillus solisalsi]|uniref:Bla regulator protein blaR1 n=1 Tax=Fictibacillus solisalsi TaxID=459525 RepID=A0A1G9TWQ0_9BACL|nr:hypothetical protein [Fictibacillus solisalsi]SDM52001.1 bla regulator protein blaR1 [Fictibacillus solisalsi]
MIKRIIFILFSTFVIGGCTNAPNHLLDGKEKISKEADQLISDYIIQKYENIYAPSKKQFEVHRIYGTNEKQGTITVYLHSYLGSFTKETGDEDQSGHSVPALIKIKKEGSVYKVVEYREPRDGDYYISSLEKMFPEKYVKKEEQPSDVINDLEIQMDKKVHKWLKQEGGDSR